MRQKYHFAMTAVLIAFSITAFAGTFADAKCVLSVPEIEAVAAKIRWRNDSGEENNSAVIRADFVHTSHRGKSGQVIDYEAFIRPDQDDVFHVIPLPLFMVQMEKNRDSVYVCAHIDTANQANTVMVFYFLRYNQIRPITPTPLPLRQIGKIIWGPVENTPLMITKVPLRILSRAQSVFMHLFSDITKIGVDRVHMTTKEIVLLAGGDLTTFDGMAVRARIPLDTKTPARKNLP